MKKRIIAAFMSILLVFQGINCFAASLNVEGWTFECVSDDGYTKKISERKPGNAALELDTKDILTLKNSSTDEIKRGQYSISICIDGDADGIQIGFTSDMKDISELSAEDTDGMKKYSGDITKKRASDKFSVVIPADVSLLIDDVSLSDADGNELIENGGFESYEIIKDKSEIYDITEAQKVQPHNFTAAVLDGALGLSWVNPTDGKIADIAVYILEGENYTLLSDDFNLSSGAVNAYKADNLVNGQRYCFMVECTFSDGEKTVSQVSAVPVQNAAEADSDLRGWDVIHPNGEFINRGSVSVDGSTSHSGKASLKFISNYDKQYNYSYISAGFPVQLEEGKKYKMICYVKSNGIITSVADISWKAYDSNQTALFSKGNSDWRRIEYTFTNTDVTKNVSLGFRISEGVGEAWIDDVEFYELAEDGTFGENLIEYGDFEFDSPVLAEVSNAKISTDESNAFITWSNSGCVNVYQKSENGLLFCGSWYDGNAVICGLDDGASHEFVLKAANENGAETEGVSLKADMVIPKLKIDKPVITMNGSVIKELNIGEVTTKISIKNNAVDEGQKVTLIVCVWKGDKMLSCQMNEQLVERTEIGEVSETIDVSANIPEDGCVMEVMVWDELHEKNILMPSIQLSFVS